MLIGSNSTEYLKKIRAKSKMYEFNISDNLHTEVDEQSHDLILMCIAIIGDISEHIWNEKSAPIIIPIRLEKELQFAAKFFDSYFHSKLNNDFNDYYILMGAVAYYFSNMNGSSKVMINLIADKTRFEFNASGLEEVIIWLLSDSYNINILNIKVNYRENIKKLIEYHNNYFSNNLSGNYNFVSLREQVFSEGNDREILFIDIILAIFKKKIYNSCLNLMPSFSELPQNMWVNTLKENPQMKEMWPSQIMLGKSGVFKGKSAVVQMPTSSGKTSSIALAIQSSFLSNRTDIVIIVAPFRSLCKEIIYSLEKFFYHNKTISVTEFSDIPESSDIDLVIKNISLKSKKIFVMTPEKLSYILKYNKEIIEQVKMIVFDEAHLFDDVTRGTNYELLLTTINSYISQDVQKILVSAVISNAEDLNNWFNRDGIVLENKTIKTSERNIAFNAFNSNNLEKAFSNLYFVDGSKNLEEEFCVPRVINTRKINKLGREKKNRYFPDFNNNKEDISIYYALKLITNGSVAIFCPRKDSASKILSRCLELEKRGILLSNFSKNSDISECVKISNLIKEHMGQNEMYSMALKGVAIHHSGVPNGIRIASEYALRNNMMKCVVCTSTLAQGINLPLKYLLISNVYQSRDLMKVRDFHNLI